MLERLLMAGEKYYFMHKEVTIIKVWDCFHLAEIKELISQRSLLVDICTLTINPNYTNSISLRLFLEEENECSEFY
ncbi:hypothetical protein HZF24_04615 [Sedimentibacter hydroxybenzoicus DSM 7310]|uniref:Uncharacterized protein n=1 Tax=Sedimentibacter hydroxybenzoicus DSM 7310 TaxID=1123245 RepID=A0A974GVJ4_SEDHY|nr:hypothetical protein [Sedimentibacter hydroxybenzoicus]NYB73419.1 hypothetical protein [Sedimentibacter hydroxybenzoicus DSM 7310]